MLTLSFRLRLVSLLWLATRLLSAAPMDPPEPAIAARLIGKWRESKSASVQYGNRTTGALAPTNGSSFFYRFNADGTYEYNGLMQVTTYGCSTQVYNQDSGRFQVAGDVLTVQPASGSVKVNQNCGSTGNTDKPADLKPRQYRFHFEQQGDTPILVIGNATGSSRPDYFRAER